MQEKISHSKTESIIYKLTRDKSLNKEEEGIIDEIIENKDLHLRSKKDN